MWQRAIQVVQKNQKLLQKTSTLLDTKSMLKNSKYKGDPARMQAFYQYQTLALKMKEYAQNVADIKEMFELAEEEKDNEVMEDCRNQLDSVVVELDALEISLLLNATSSCHSNCYVEIMAGAGGKDSNDWVKMLMDMYVKFTVLEHLKCKVVSINETEEGGLRNVVLEIVGTSAFGYCSVEAGVHKLVRISPFDSQVGNSFYNLFINVNNI